jgi:hypothetical protein
MEFVNLTPHPVNIITEKSEITIPSSGVARLKQSECPEGKIGEIPIVRTLYGELELPPDVDINGKFVIVSNLVASVASQELLFRGAKAILVPNTGSGAVRDEQGRICGVKSLILVAGELQ